MTNTNTICPICGYPALMGPPYDEHGGPTYEICPCCGIEFGNDDWKIPHAELRDCWIKLGMKWRFLPAPDGWDPIKQLKAAGLWSPLLPQDQE